jgi:hypothetical protein
LTSARLNLRLFSVGLRSTFFSSFSCFTCFLCFTCSWSSCWTSSSSRGAMADWYHCCTRRLRALSYFGRAVSYFGRDGRDGRDCLAYSHGVVEKDFLWVRAGDGVCGRHVGQGWKTLGARKGRTSCSASATSLTCRAAHRGIGGHRQGEEDTRLWKYKKLGCCSALAPDFLAAHSRLRKPSLFCLLVRHLPHPSTLRQDHHHHQFISVHTLQT